MNWYPKLYLSKTAAKKKMLIQKIESGKPPMHTYLITLAPGMENQLEIIPAWELKFWHSGRAVPPVIGIGCSRMEAFELVRRITEDVYRKTKGAGLRAYFGSMEYASAAHSMEK